MQVLTILLLELLAFKRKINYDYTIIGRGCVNGQLMVIKAMYEHYTVNIACYVCQYVTGYNIY